MIDARRLIAFVATMMLFSVFAGCGKSADPVAQAGEKDVVRGVPTPGVVETKAVAEEGFIYGLPIVMNYTVMYKYAVDKNSGQFKAPFNQIHN